MAGYRGYAYYNENDPSAAAWLRELVGEGRIAPGDVDTRSIRDVQPSDLTGYRQVHLFAGIGGWSLALRYAGWPDDRPVWTGSCPCQPFSAAGRRGGTADERHLWPEMFRLVAERLPATIFGEQVASRDGLAWLDLVFDDLEGAGYACGAADLCAAGVGAPHIRQRLWWVADRVRDGAPARAEPSASREDPRGAGWRECGQPGDNRSPGVLGDARAPGLPPREREALGGSGWREEGRATLQPGGPPDGMGDTDPGGRSRERGRQQDGTAEPGALGHNGGPPLDTGPLHGFWRDADWLRCRDGRWRPVEPGAFPLAHGVPGRVGRLRGYGNAVVPQVAATFVRAYLDAEPERSVLSLL